MAAARVARHGLLFLRVPSLPVACNHVRLTHSTPIVLKKKDRFGSASSSQTLFDDAEDEFPAEEELFASHASSSSQASTGAPTTPGGTTEQFDSLLTSTLQHLNRPGKKGNPPRRSVVKRLCIMARTKEQLEKIMDLIAVMRNNRILVSNFNFFTRCIKLCQPELILQVLQNRPKYGLDVDSLAQARTILNALAQSQSRKDHIDAMVTNCFALAELYPLYGFPPASKDLISSMILAEVLACQAKKALQSGETHEAFPEILKAVKAAAEPWDPSSLVAKREGRWLRRSTDSILSAARKSNDLEPWLLDFSKHIQEGLHL